LENLIDYLIPLIVILTFLSFRSKRKKAKEEDPDKPKKKSAGLFGKMNKLMEEYYESDLKGAPPQSKSAEPEPWEDDPWEVNPAYAESEPAEDQEEPEPQPVPMKEPEAEKRRDNVVKPVVVAPIVSKALPLEYLPKKISKQDLRKAIVWSEILGPPVALKEK